MKARAFLLIFGIALVATVQSNLPVNADTYGNSQKSANQEVSGWLEKINSNADFYKTEICFDLPKISIPLFSDDSEKNVQLLKDFQNYLYGKLFTDTVDRIKNCANISNPDYFSKSANTVRDMYGIRLAEKTRFTQTCITYVLSILPPPELPLFTASSTENQIILDKYKESVDDKYLKTIDYIQNRYDPVCLTTEKFYQKQSNSLSQQYSQMFKTKYPNACSEVNFPPQDPGYSFVQNAYLQGGPSAADYRVNFYERLLISRFENLASEISEKCSNTVSIDQNLPIYNVVINPNLLKAGSKFEVTFDFNCQTLCGKPVIELTDNLSYRDLYVSDQVIKGNTKKGTWKFDLKIPEYSNISGIKPIQILLIDGVNRHIYNSSIQIEPKNQVVIRTDLKSEISKSGKLPLELNFKIWLERIETNGLSSKKKLENTNFSLSFEKGVMCNSNFSPIFDIKSESVNDETYWGVKVKMEGYTGNCSIPIYLRLPTEYILTGSDQIKFRISNVSKTASTQEILCVKANKSIKVSGVNPRCPTGYVKK